MGGTFSEIKRAERNRLSKEPPMPIPPDHDDRGRFWGCLILLAMVALFVAAVVVIAGTWGWTAPAC